MSLVDAFSAEDRVDVKYSDFYALVKGCTERDILMNAVKAKVPYDYIECIMTGELKSDFKRNPITKSAPHG